MKSSPFLIIETGQPFPTLRRYGRFPHWIRVAAGLEKAETVVVNGADYSVLANLATGTFPQTIAIDGETNTVYVTNKARGLPRDAPAGTPVPIDPTGDTVTIIRP